MLSWSPDGSKLAYISFSSIFIIDGNTFNQVKIPVDGIYVGSRPSWSPDGTRIAYCVGPGLGDPMPEESTHIWVMNSDGTNRINLTANRRYSFNPSWSPDGTRITFSSNGELSIMNADGTDQIQLFDNSKGYIGHSMWSLDGHKIAFLRSQLSSEIIGLYIANIDGSDAVRVIENENVSAEFAWSGDSKKIAFTMKTDLYLQIFIANIDRTNQLRLTDNTQDSYGLCWVQ
jgi:Tol biopolymer transport system component